MKVLNERLISSLSAQAKQNPRLRQHFNIHDSYEEPSQRLLNAMEPGSYIRPHRHLTDPKSESFVGIRGKMAIMVFNESGEIEQIASFGPQEDVIGVDLPPGIWHTVVCLEEGSVFYETKPGPFKTANKKNLFPAASTTPR